ncbi:MAG: bifunctional hydroxymethylpyrimidine kinase/phosphomethylpyrimidine kinase [Chloroflexi bacterium]|nr:bifunctional hydroxymethylpyrimidine kinase/phosphomethylpyrimidine kinase [Chloroflexota bacterium]
MHVALTIAGSDSGGGAGIQADLKTFLALGVFGTSAITAITAQNTQAVKAIHELPLDMIAAQIDAVVEDLRPDCVKIGMLSSAAIVRLVAERLRRYHLSPVVLDPVLMAKSGDVLLQPDAVQALIDELLPLATIITPNIPEAESLIGGLIKTPDDQEEAAHSIVTLGARAAVVKGGHRPDSADDVLWHDGRAEWFRASRVDTPNTHGTGCTFSAAIASYLARGEAITASVRQAKDYLTGALRHAPPLGQGHGPLHHGWRVELGGVR